MGSPLHEAFSMGAARLPQQLPASVQGSLLEIPSTELMERGHTNVLRSSGLVHLATRGKSRVLLQSSFPAVLL